MISKVKVQSLQDPASAVPKVQKITEVSFIEEYYFYSHVRSSGIGVLTCERRATGAPEWQASMFLKGHLERECFGHFGWRQIAFDCVDLPRQVEGSLIFVHFWTIMKSLF
jgi:hypothetical protein